MNPTRSLSRSEVPGGDVVTYLHVGSYDELNGVYASMNAWISENGKPAVRLEEWLETLRDI